MPLIAGRLLDARDLDLGAEPLLGDAEQDAPVACLGGALVADEKEFLPRCTEGDLLEPGQRALVALGLGAEAFPVVALDERVVVRPRAPLAVPTLLRALKSAKSSSPGASSPFPRPRFTSMRLSRGMLLLRTSEMLASRNIVVSCLAGA